MANTWAGTPTNALVEKRAVYDAVVNAGVAMWAGAEPSPSWSADDTVPTWNELAAAVALDSGYPTGLDCPSKSECSTWFTDPTPVIDSCSAAGGILQAICYFDTGYNCNSVRVQVYDDLDQFITSRDVETEPDTAGYDEAFSLAAGNYYFKVIPYSLGSPPASGVQGDFCQTPSTVEVISF